MPLTDAEERQKLAWEIELMSTQIDRGRIDLEKIRQDIDKTRADMALDQKRFWVQLWGVIATMIAAFAGVFAAGATWWNYVIHH